MIKISGFRSVLHNSEQFNKGNEEFLHDIEKEIGEELVFSDLEDYDCNLKLIFIESGGSEGLFLNNFDLLKPPYYLLTSGTNNSLAASLEIMTYLKSKGLDGEILHGGASYIGKRILELKNSKKNRLLEGVRIGVYGRPSDWLIASVPEYQKCMDILGVEFVDIPLEIVERKYNLLSFSEDKYTGFDELELKKAHKLYKAILSISKEYKLDAMTIRCFDLLSSLHTTGCLTLSLLNNEGIISSCEGDIMSLISMLIIHKCVGALGFQANPSQMDIEKNQMIFAHCTIPTYMCESFRYDTHFESGTGVAIKGELKEADVTVFRLSKDFKNYFLSEGKIIRNMSLPNLCRTQIDVVLEEPLEKILKNPAGNHHIIFYGKHKKEILESLEEIL